MKNLSLASVLSSASVQSCTTARAELAETRISLIAKLGKQAKDAAKHTSHVGREELTLHVRRCCQVWGEAGKRFKGPHVPVTRATQMAPTHATHPCHTDPEGSAQNSRPRKLGCLQIVAGRAEYTCPLASACHLQLVCLERRSSSANHAKEKGHMKKPCLSWMLPLDFDGFYSLCCAKVQLHINRTFLIKP